MIAPSALVLRHLPRLLVVHRIRQRVVLLPPFPEHGVAQRRHLERELGWEVGDRLVFSAPNGEPVAYEPIFYDRPTDLFLLRRVWGSE